MSEKSLWSWIRPYLPQGHYTRIESPDTSPGVPDVNYIVGGTEGWIELKEARHAKSEVPFPTEETGLHRTQIIWIEEHVTYEGRVWIAARIDRQILWIPGKYARAFNGAPRHRLDFFSALTIDQEKSVEVGRLSKLLRGDHR